MSNLPRPSLRIQCGPAIRCVNNQEADDDGVADGVVDASLDGSLNVGTDDTPSGDSDDASDLETGDSITAIRQLGTDDGELEPDLDTGRLLDEPSATAPEDDLDGPLAVEQLLSLEPELASDESDTDNSDGAFADELIAETLPALDWDEQSLDDSASESFSPNAADLSDIAIPWVSQPWSEQKLRTAFVARESINARRNVLLAAGEAIDFLSLDDFSSIDDKPPPGRARFACFLDNNCKSVLVIQSTGHIVVWNREISDFDHQGCQRFSQIDLAADIWSAPAGNTTWVRLETGQVLCSTSELGAFKLVSLPGRCVAMGGSDEALLCLVRQSNGLSLLAVHESGFKSLAVSGELAMLTPARDFFLVTLNQVVLVGARGHGLWLSTDGGVTFRNASGCRNVTACTLGNFSGRIYAWAALFFELDDRAELVGIDLRTSRVQKLSEYRVMSDSMGPEDDPPERARVDCLLWDSARQRMLVAGCFGLACFVPPQSTNPTS